MFETSLGVFVPFGDARVGEGYAVVDVLVRGRLDGYDRAHSFFTSPRLELPPEIPIGIARLALDNLHTVLAEICTHVFRAVRRVQPAGIAVDDRLVLPGNSILALANPFLYQCEPRRLLHSVRVESIGALCHSIHSNDIFGDYTIITNALRRARRRNGRHRLRKLSRCDIRYTLRWTMHTHPHHQPRSEHNTHKADRLHPPTHVRVLLLIYA